MSDADAGTAPPVMEDWAQLVRAQPRAYHRPRSVDELRALLSRVAGEKGRLRVPGSLHSCSHIWVADEIVDVSQLPRTLEFDEGDTAVAASANWPLHDFLLELSRRGKSVTATGGTDHQSLAGLISTATAPASSRHALYDLLEWVEYLTVDPDSGAVVEKRLARDDPGFGAAVCSLGAIGVLTRVRFQLVDELYFRVVQKIVDMDDVLADLDATSAKYDFWRVNWLPRGNQALLWAATRIPREEADADGDYPADQSEHILDFIFHLWDRVADSGPLLDTAIDLLYRVLALTYGVKRANGPLRNMLPVDRRAPLHVAMAEWSFDPRRLNDVLRECRAYFDRHGWPNIPTEIELTRTDDRFMSPWNWQGLPYIVKLNFMYLTEVCRTPAEKEQIYQHLQGLWRHLEGAGIPFKAHWGKINFIDPEFTRRNHQPDEFRPFVSPVFLNDYLIERLGAAA
jgi:FAD/FMN-containing dehydrogenase